MKKKMMLLCGMLAGICLFCGLIAAAYVMGSAGAAGSAVINTDKAILCTIAAVGVGVAVMLKRHYKRVK